MWRADSERWSVQVASDAQRPMSNARRQEHGPAHARRTGANAAGKDAAWELLGRDAATHADHPALGCDGAADTGRDVAGSLSAGLPADGGGWLMRRIGQSGMVGEQCAVAGGKEWSHDMSEDLSSRGVSTAASAMSGANTARATVVPSHGVGAIVPHGAQANPATRAGVPAACAKCATSAGKPVPTVPVPWRTSCATWTRTAGTARTGASS